MGSVGLKLLSEGEQPVVADLVFGHGLRGDYLETWSCGDICWPRDLLPNDPRETELQNKRVISVSTVETFSHLFLMVVVGLRFSRNPTERQYK